MSFITDYLRNKSRIEQTITQVEANEEVDWAKLGRLQALDLARIGELYLLEQLEKEEQADQSLTPDLFNVQLD
jgi:hypothetical protein